MTERDVTETAAAPAVVQSPEQVAGVDALILSVATGEYCKVAVLIARAVDAAKAQGLDVASGAIVPRIYALAESGQLTVQGNVRRWRAGEVKRGE